MMHMVNWYRFSLHNARYNKNNKEYLLVTENINIVGFLMAGISLTLQKKPLNLF